MLKNGCQVGCKKFTGGEIKHHKDCQFYSGSMSEMYDNLKSEVKTLRLRSKFAETKVWISCDDRLPDHLQTVWLANNISGWIALGCLVITNEGWHWAESNGVIYVDEGKIVSECESDDLDVTHWCALPKPPRVDSSINSEERMEICEHKNIEPGRDPFHPSYCSDCGQEL